MSLSEDAIQAYEKEEEINRQDAEKERQKLVEDGFQNIKERFGNNIEIEVTSDKDGEVVFLVEDLKMKVRKARGYYTIFLVQECPICHKEYEDSVLYLKDIGRLLKNGHNSYECEKVLKEKELVKELNTGEKLLQVLQTFIYENSPEN